MAAVLSSSYDESATTLQIDVHFCFRIGFVLNVTDDIDNFYPAQFQYYNVRVQDVPEEDLLPYWDQTFRLIEEAR